LETLRGLSEPDHIFPEYDWRRRGQDYNFWEEMLMIAAWRSLAS